MVLYLVSYIASTPSAAAFLILFMYLCMVDFSMSKVCAALLYLTLKGSPDSGDQVPLLMAFCTSNLTSSSMHTFATLVIPMNWDLLYTRWLLILTSYCQIFCEDLVRFYHLCQTCLKCTPDGLLEPVYVSSVFSLSLNCPLTVFWEWDKDLYIQNMGTSVVSLWICQVFPFWRMFWDLRALLILP